VNGSSHQAVSWTIYSPLLVDPIHITGVYVSPSEGEVEEFFHTLTQQDRYPDREIHVYTGDFNAHVGEELEAHITLQERSTIPFRVGDTLTLATRCTCPHKCKNILPTAGSPSTANAQHYVFSDSKWTI